MIVIVALLSDHGGSSLDVRDPTIRGIYYDYIFFPTTHAPQWRYVSLVLLLNCTTMSVPVQARLFLV